MPDTHKIQAMREGGKILADVRERLVMAVKPGISFIEIEKLANDYITSYPGATASFKRVPGYSWATCLMKNEEVCHGIPRKEKYVQDNDLITIDVGVFFKGYHTDTSTTVYVGEPTPQIIKFLEAGKRSVDNAIQQARPGKSVWHISYAMQRAIETAGYHCVYQLTGHGVGKELHEEPSIPCVADPTDKRIQIKSGQTLAIEVMYSVGSPTLIFEKDGWTCRTEDNSLSGMFEHTVLVTDNGPEILTL